jgi:tetratricopeptide (TPR) repeat protein
MTGRLTVPGKTVGELRKGVVVEVLHVKDEWIWVRSGKAGWLQDKYVLPLQEGVAFFTNEIRRNAKDGAAYESRGHIYRNLGDYENAIRDYDAALRLNPSNAFVIKNRAFANFQKGEYAAAITDYNRALRLNPKDAGAWNDRGHNYYQLKQYSRALADYDAALRLEPEHVTALNNRAWLLATCSQDELRDGKRAVASARKACELAKPADYDYVDTLAAAYAEAGYFDLAVKVAEDAIRLAPSSEKPAIQRRLAIYREKRPYHEPAD